MTGAGHGVPMIESGIAGFDQIAGGGLPKARATLVSGASGTGKTLFALQFIVSGATQAGEPGVVVTCEESPADLRANVRSLGWDLQALEDAGSLAIVDLSPDPAVETISSGTYDLGAIVARIAAAVERVGARRVAVDSIGALFAAFDGPTVRRELYRLMATLKSMGLTSVITAELPEHTGGISVHGVEEFVADAVVVLRNVFDGERRRRTVEVLKLRGSSHQGGEFPFTVTSEGPTVLPMLAIVKSQEPARERVSTGNDDLDEMLGGGPYRGSLILVAGPTGTGKTLLANTFACAGERTVMFAFEESYRELVDNAAGWGLDVSAAEHDGRLRILSEFPEMTSLEGNLLRIFREIEEFEPERITIDSLSALERVSAGRPFQQFLIALASYVKARGITTLVTTTSPLIDAGMGGTMGHISTLTDAILLLRYVEVDSAIRRGMAVLKLRGSAHESRLRQFTVTDAGLRVLAPFEHVDGILGGLVVGPQAPAAS